jgi:hypothetical protein
VQIADSHSVGYTLGFVLTRGFCCLLVVGFLVWSGLPLARRLSRGRTPKPPQPPQPPPDPSNF